MQTHCLPLRRRPIWPSRATPGLPRAAFVAAFAMTEEPAPAPAPITVDVFSALAQMVDLVRLVGLPEMYSPDAKGTALIETGASGSSRFVRLIFRRLRSRDVVEKAGAALENLLAAFGQKVAIREVMHAPNMGGWAAVLRFAPTHEGRAWKASSRTRSFSSSSGSLRPA